MAVAELELPLTSFTVRVTVFGPTSAQAKELLSRLIEAIPQLSELLLSMSPVLICPAPEASNTKVMS